MKNKYIYYSGIRFCTYIIDFNIQYSSIMYMILLYKYVVKYLILPVTDYLCAQKLFTVLQFIEYTGLFIENAIAWLFEHFIFHKCFSRFHKCFVISAIKVPNTKLSILM